MHKVVAHKISLAVAVSLAFCGCAVADEEVSTPTEARPIDRSGLVQKLAGGEIDWSDQMMYAWAEAPIPSSDKEPNYARAYLRAKDYAKMEAIAKLLAVVEGTTVTYERSGKDLMNADLGLRRTIEGYVRNVEILATETFELDGEKAVRVTVGTRMFGEATPGTALLDKLAATEKPKQPPLIELPEEVSVRIQLRAANACINSRFIGSSRPVDLTAEAPAATGHGPYTSLVVDARGFGVPQALSPKIRRMNGDQIYGSILPKSDPALRAGTVSYARNLEAARRCDKCGDNPLIVRAVGRGGGKSMCDVMVSDSTADKILEENKVSKFLEARKVIFVVDQPGSALFSPTSAARSQLHD